MRKKSYDLIDDSVLNKGTAFTEAERKTYKLGGLLPFTVENINKQVQRQTKQNDLKDSNIEKYVHLRELLNSNERLFYKLISSDIKKFMPLIYTPTVGEACQKFSNIWTHPQGMYITRYPGITREDISAMFSNWKSKDVKAIVMTDGQRILGLGDLGVNGMGIPVGKLQLYSACAGIPSSQCLPITIDNGTNNEECLADELYMGKREKRNNDAEYRKFIRDVLEAARDTFGKSVLLQFEDFGNETAFDLLKENQYDFNCFNDDIQGTASVALAGILASLKAKGATNNLAEHKILFLGAGEAGTGIGELIAYAIARTSDEKISQEDACRDNIFFVDSKGLISTARKDKLPHHKKMFQQGSDFDSKDFLEAVKELKPTIIVGVSAQPNTFTKEVCEEMAKINETPIIFALSNPTDNCECTAEQAYKWTDETCIFASGSPFPDYLDKKGEIKFSPGQGNNAYIFPGIALGVIATKAKFIPQELFLIAAEALSKTVTEADLEIGAVYPPLEKIKQVSLEIATEVAHACFNPLEDPRDETKTVILATEEQPETVKGSKESIKQWLSNFMDDHEYESKL